MATLSTLSTRVKTFLMDSSALVWAADDITEAIRLALGEYNLASSGIATIDGLDSATSTTLPAVYDFVIVVGAAGYAASARGVDRVEGFDEDKESGSLTSWAALRLKEFRAFLAMAFPGYSTTQPPAPDSNAPAPAEAARQGTLRTTTNPAWGTWTETDGIDYGPGYDRS